MFRVGKYYKVNSMIHAINPMVKIFMSLIFIVSCLITNNLTAILILTGFMLVVIIASNVPILEYLCALWSAKLFIILLVLMNLIFNQSILQLAIITLQLILIVLMTSTLIFTTRISALTYAVELILSPLKLLNIPTKKIAFAITLAIRFIPILLNESKNVIKSMNNRSKKVRLTIKDRFINIKNAIVPIFNKSIEHADRMADVMTVRNYSFDSRTNYLRDVPAKELDFALIATQLLILMAIIVKG